jgi:adenylyl cyclase-associated protein
VQNALIGQRKFLLISSKAKKPSDMNNKEFAELLKPMQDGIVSANDIRDANRGSPVFNQLSTISESISFIAWVTLDSKPHKHVDECLGSGQYWGNRVLKEFKER